MKNIHKIFALALMFAALGACEDEDKTTYLHAPELQHGAYFRNIENGGIFNKNDGFVVSSYSITGEVVSRDISEVATLDFSIAFQDNSTDGDPDTEDDFSIAPVLIETVNVSSLSVNSNGFPEKTYELTADEIFAALNLDDTDIEGGDLIIFSIVITMTDGTVFNSSNTGDSVRGELFFRSPLDYTSSIVCLDAPTPGDWVLDMQDLYGDGWNGGTITVNMDGVLTTYSVSSESGTTQTETITVPEGTYVFTWTYTSGDWEEENVYTLTDPNDNVVLDEGPTPTVGELLNQCD
ncbi:hypothetical protein [Flagellimonas myxillae]|uniref:hypothetical protein n=1 Tax=Flagellimonas myxillae TaxID=2942214 RepID=UPI00201F6DFB|nr:hypothetical protein [Muricauda myxillae]MCL6267673.1 hypothetical protein [Muricauda myxillae]